MGKAQTKQRKITLWVPTDLLEDALASSSSNITDTVRRGLALIAASRAFATLKGMRGRHKSSLNVAELRTDRR